MPANGRHYLASACASAAARKTSCICSGWNRRWTPCHASPGKLPSGSAGRWPATALIPPHRDAGQRPALPGHQPSASATARKTCCICSGWSRRWTPCHASPGKLPNGSVGRWPATALIPPHRDAGQRPALPGHQPSASATARKTCCICSGWNRRWTPCHASPGKLPNGSAGRWPATALIPPHRDAGQRPALPGHQPSASATARKTCCICSGLCSTCTSTPSGKASAATGTAGSSSTSAGPR
ncbi:hypothetical protein DP16_4355 [Stenotrophomonas maltophilia]|nr:hypothetical protein DP16_4355 [Stenotrophomonas maltophilia]